MRGIFLVPRAFLCQLPFFSIIHNLGKKKSVATALTGTGLIWALIDAKLSCWLLVLDALPTL
jgi:hypothetical protein